MADVLARGMVGNLGSLQTTAKDNVVDAINELKAGGSGGDKNYVFTQSTASSSWAITHNMNKYPSVTVVNGSNNVVIGEVSYTNANSLTITFSIALLGSAYLN